MKINFLKISDNEIIDLIKKNKILIDNMLINNIILFRKTEVIKYLFKEQKIILDELDNEGRTILYNIIKYNYIDYLNLFLENDKKNIGISLNEVVDKNDNLSIIYCIIFNNFEVFKILDEKNFNVYYKNSKGNNCFILSVNFEKYNFTKYLIEKYNDFNFTNSNNENLLYLLMQAEKYKLVDLLLKKKINPNTEENEYGITPLIICVHNSNIEYIDKLIKYGADINKGDYYGNTSMHYAVFDSKINIIELLINYPQINLNIQNINGMTPLHLICQNSKLLNLLIEKKLFKKILLKSDLNLLNNKGESSGFLFVKTKRWEEFTDILEKKDLNVLTKTINNYDILDITNNNEKIIDIVAKRYLKLLDETEIKNLENNWEKQCKNKLYNDLLKNNKVKNLIKNITSNQRCLHIIKEKIIKKNKYKPLNLYKDIIIDNGIFIDVCFYTGSTIDIIYGLIYLNNKFTNIDILIEYPLTQNKSLENFYEMLSIDYPYKLDFSNFEINWIPINIFYPTYLESKITNSNKRFIVISISIELTSGKSHANMIIIDKKNKTIERFEPSGAHPPNGFFYNNELLDLNLKNKFNKYFDDFEYLKPMDYLPQIGFQKLENLEYYNCKRIGDPNGFCGIWCTWWVFQRIKYHYIDPKTLAVQLIEKFKIDKILIPNMIRNFSEKITSLRDQTLKKNNMDINDWINSNYDEDTLNNIEKDTFNLIK